MNATETELLVCGDVPLGDEPSTGLRVGAQVEELSRADTAFRVRRGDGGASDRDRVRAPRRPAMDARKQGDRVSGEIQGVDHEAGCWRVVSQFEDGYELGYGDGFGSGAAVGAVCTAAVLFAMWGLL